MFTEVLELSDIFSTAFGMIPIGFGLGCLPMLFGIGIHGVLKIFKQA